MILKLIFAAVVISSTLAIAQEERITFRGAYIGQPVTDFANCSGKPKAIKEGYKTRGKSCDAPRFVVSHVTVKGHLNPSFSGEGFLFTNGKLTQISIEIQNEDWSQVRADLTQKLGEPLSEIPQTFQNGYGARWEYNRGFWQKGDLVASAKVQVTTIGSELGTTAAPETAGILITIESAKSASTQETPNSLD